MSLLPGTRSHSLASCIHLTDFQPGATLRPPAIQGCQVRGQGTVQMFDWGHRQILTGTCAQLVVGHVYE